MVSGGTSGVTSGGTNPLTKVNRRLAEGRQRLRQLGVRAD
jgi:hypothetical protein